MSFESGAHADMMADTRQDSILSGNGSDNEIDDRSLRPGALAVHSADTPIASLGVVGSFDTSQDAMDAPERLFGHVRNPTQRCRQRRAAQSVGCSVAAYNRDW